MSLDDLATKNAQFAMKPPPFGGRHIHHQRDVCLTCGLPIFRRSSQALEDEWAHEDAYDDNDRRLCEVGYPSVIAVPASVSAALPAGAEEELGVDA